MSTMTDYKYSIEEDCSFAMCFPYSPIYFKVDILSIYLRKRHTKQQVLVDKLF